MRNCTEGARDRLGAFWRRVSQEGSSTGAAAQIVQSMLGFWHMQGFSPFGVFEQFANFLSSPNRTNPLNINPLRDLIDMLIDFDNVRANDGLKLFISATNVRTGKIKVFSGAEVTSAAVMASACLPYLFQAVGIGEEAYWDGDYTGNPALFPFFRRDRNCGYPGGAGQSGAPGGAAEIAASDHRTRQRDHLQLVAAARIPRHRFRKSVDRGRPARSRPLPQEPGSPHRRHRRTRPLHRSLKTRHQLALLQELHAAGRAAGKEWLAAHYDDLGMRSTVNLRAEFD